MFKRNLIPLTICLGLIAGFICCGSSDAIFTTSANTTFDPPRDNSYNEQECCWPAECPDIIDFDSTEHVAADPLGVVEVIQGQDFIVCENDSEDCYVLTNWNATVDFRGQQGIFPVLLEVRANGTEDVKLGAFFFSRVFIASSGMGLTFAPGSKVVIRLVQTPQATSIAPGVGIAFTTVGHVR